MMGFRQAMGRLQDNLDSTAQARTAGFDDVSDGRMIELEKLTKLIQQEAGNRQQSEASMMQLLEGMHQKMHTEVFLPTSCPARKSNRFYAELSLLMYLPLLMLSVYAPGDARAHRTPKHRACADEIAGRVS